MDGMAAQMRRCVSSLLKIVAIFVGGWDERSNFHCSNKCVRNQFLEKIDIQVLNYFCTNELLLITLISFHFSQARATSSYHTERGLEDSSSD